MKSLLKLLIKNVKYFSVLKDFFSKICKAKVKEHIFVCPQIRNILSAKKKLEQKLLNNKLVAWKSLKETVKILIVNNKSQDYKRFVSNMLHNCIAMVCCMSQREGKKRNFSLIPIFPQPGEGCKRGAR